MTALISFLTILAVSILVTKVATVALTRTGLSRESARFQARSAFSGVGFTTSESEGVVAHPVRRRILLLLMLLGNAGLVSAMSSLVLTFFEDQQGSLGRLHRLAIVLAGVTVLWLLANSRLLDRWLKRIIEWALNRWTRIDVRDYASLLHLTGNYQVQELAVQEGDWLAERTLRDLLLREEGVLVLGIQRTDGTYVGAPNGDTSIEIGDVLLLYGRKSTLQDLDERQSGTEGDREHNRCVTEQRNIERKEQGEEAARAWSKAEKNRRSRRSRDP